MRRGGSRDAAGRAERGSEAAAGKRQLPGQGFAGGICTDLLARYFPVSPSVSAKEKKLFPCRAERLNPLLDRMVGEPAVGECVLKRLCSLMTRSDSRMVNMSGFENELLETSKRC